MNAVYTFLGSPAGFDNMRNISVLFDNLIILNPDDDYKIIIRSPNQYQKVIIIIYIFLLCVKIKMNK